MRKIIWFLIYGTILSACANSFEHDQQLAAQRAEEFARVAFVGKDFEKGYELLSSSGRRYVPFDKFKETIVKSHPRSYPTKITATEYEPMSGEEAIYIYLIGDNGSEHFYYTITLAGTATTGYQVTRFSRGSGPFGSGGSRQRLGN
jgi:hypothetical protein